MICEDGSMDIDDVKNFLRGKEDRVLLRARDIDDPTYTTVKDVVMKVYPNAENNDFSISVHCSKLFDSLRHMETNDFNKIINTFKKYEVKGENRGITGRRTYGYDTSRLDRKMYRRKRSN